MLSNFSITKLHPVLGFVGGVLCVCVCVFCFALVCVLRGQERHAYLDMDMQRCGWQRKTFGSSPTLLKQSLQADPMSLQAILCLPPKSL